MRKLIEYLVDYLMIGAALISVVGIVLSICFGIPYLLKDTFAIEIKRNPQQKEITKCQQKL